MEKDKIYIVNGDHWVLHGTKTELLCPDDKIPMREVKDPFAFAMDQTSMPTCPVCGYQKAFHYPFETAKQDVQRIILSKQYQKMDVVDIDGIATPVLKKKINTSDSKYFASLQINESKRGPQLVIYAGRSGSSEKSQIFVTPETKKMSFDHKDVKPTDIFTKITAEFIDGSSNVIRRSDK